MDAAPTEARLDLDVDREAAALAAGGGLGRRRGTDSGRDRGVERRQRSAEEQLVPHRDRHAVAHGVGREFGRYREQDHDRDFDAGLPQLQRLVVRGDAEASDAVGHECPRDRHRPVAVGIGLDNRLDADPRRQEPLEQPNVGGELGQIDLEPGGLRQGRQNSARPGVDQRMARGRNPTPGCASGRCHVASFAPERGRHRWSAPRSPLPAVQRASCVPGAARP